MSLFSWFGRHLPRRRNGDSKPWSPETGKFVDLATSSGLRNAAEMRDAFGAFRSEVPTPHQNGIAELNDFCDHLVENNVLTRWQCERLLEGRYKGFFLDAFKLLRHVGHEGNCSTYAAENVQTKHRVMLRVFPFNMRREDGQPYYEVEESDEAE